MQDGTSETPCNVPVWFKVTGNSMFPFIRAHRDEVMLVPVKQEDLKVGDIVLFPGKYKGGDYCLHRLYKIDGDSVQTFGDGNNKPDGWFPKRFILGKAVLIKRGNLTIDCESPKWVKRFSRWNYLWKIRPVVIFPFKVFNKLDKMIRKRKKRAKRSKQT